MYTYIHIHLYIHIHIHIHIHTCVCVCVCMRACVSIYIFIILLTWLHGGGHTELRLTGHGLHQRHELKKKSSLRSHTLVA